MGNAEFVTDPTVLGLLAAALFVAAVIGHEVWILVRVRRARRAVDSIIRGPSSYRDPAAPVRAAGTHGHARRFVATDRASLRQLRLEEPRAESVNRA